MNNVALWGRARVGARVTLRQCLMRHRGVRPDIVLPAPGITDVAENNCLDSWLSKTQVRLNPAGARSRSLFASGLPFVRGRQINTGRTESKLCVSRFSSGHRNGPGAYSALRGGGAGCQLEWESAISRQGQPRASETPAGGGGEAS